MFNGRAVPNDETTGVDVEASGKLAEFQAIIKTGRPFVLEVKGAQYGLSPDRIEKPLGNSCASDLQMTVAWTRICVVASG